jgi:hypothetical protein
MAHALQQHYVVLLLSILSLFLAVAAFTAYGIYGNAFVTKAASTVPFLFFSLAVMVLLGIAVLILRWNRRWVSSSEKKEGGITVQIVPA